MITDPDWEALTPEQKRDVRFQRWLSPDVAFDSPQAQKAYQERVTRFIKAIKIEIPDRVPVLTPAGFLPAYHGGASLRKVMYDYEELKRCWLKFLDDFEFDAFPGPGLVLSAKQMEILGHRLHEWPGHGMGDQVATFQYVEGEYMTVDEYDDLITDPTDYLLRTYLPRTNTALAGLARLRPMTPMVGIPMFYLNQFADPGIRTAIQTILDVADEGMRWGRIVMEVSRTAMARGVPGFGGPISQAPYDMLGDMMRGTRNIMLDMYKRPDKLHAAMDKLVPLAIREGVIGAENAISPLVFMPLHKGTGGFMSNQQFATFYWPSLKKVCEGLVAEGLVPYLFAEGDYTQRLEIIQDMPKSSVVWYFENMDMAYAKKMLKDKACIAGNLPVSTLITGTPDQVKQGCRKLIEACAEGGGYILTGSASMNEGRAENLQAMMEAAKAYGKY